MRFTFLLVFALHMFKFGTMELLNPCMAKEYKELKDSEVRKIMATEYSIFSDVLRLGKRNDNEFSLTEIFNRNEICACVIIKIDEKSEIVGGTNADFETTLTDVSVALHKDLTFKVGYFSKSPKQFPSFTCQRVRGDGEKYIIIKGPRNQSIIGRRVHNIYIASYTDNIEKYQLKGFIEKVDVELEVNEIPGTLGKVDSIIQEILAPLYNKLLEFVDVPTPEPFIIKAATEKATASLIFLHGQGGTGKDCSWLMKRIAFELPHMRVICPTADLLPIYYEHDMKMPAWFNVYGHHINSHEDRNGIEKATAFVHNLIEKEIEAGIRAERIVIGGYSQGAALALRAALFFHEKLAGVFALSGWLPLHREFSRSKSQMKANENIHILLYHRRYDNVVYYKYAEITHSLLEEITKNCEFIMRPGFGHHVSFREMKKVGEFLKSRIPAI